MKLIERVDLEEYPGSRENCSVKKALSIFGDRWSLLIIRELFYGCTRFEDFRRNLGIARNILTSRLEKLEHDEIIFKKRLHKDTVWSEYRLTERGADLFTTVCALIQWGDHWLQDNDKGPITVIEESSGIPIDRLTVSAEGRPLSITDITYRPNE